MADLAGAERTVSDLADLLDELGLPDIEALEEYCEDELEFLASVWTEEDDGQVRLIIMPVGSLVATGLAFPFTMGFFSETLIDVEEQWIGFA